MGFQKSTIWSHRLGWAGIVIYDAAGIRHRRTTVTPKQIRDRDPGTSEQPDTIWDEWSAERFVGGSKAYYLLWALRSLNGNNSA